MLARILRAPTDSRALQQVPHLRKIRKRNAHRALCVGCAQSRSQGAEQSLVFGQAAMHFPVAGNELPAHHVLQQFKLVNVTASD
jgi:hypothetical protein